MITPELIAYVRAAFAQGKSRDQVRQELLANGDWHESDVNEAFASIDGSGSIVPASRKSLIKITLAVVILACIGYAAWFAYGKYRTGLQPTDTSQNALGTEEVQGTSTDTNTNQESGVSSEQSSLASNPVRDYEVRIISGPKENSTYYVGDTIEATVEIGKYFNGLEFAGIGMYPSENPDHITKIRDGLYHIKIKIAPTNNEIQLGRTNITIIGKEDREAMTAANFVNFKDLKKAAYIPITLDSKAAVSSIQMEPASFATTVAGSMSPQGEYMPSAPIIMITFTNGVKAMLLDKSIGEFSIGDATIASARETSFIFADFLPMKVLDIKGLKAGSTTFTFTYKGVSKTIPVLVKN